jgi:hypothetical protein
LSNDKRSNDAWNRIRVKAIEVKYLDFKGVFGLIAPESRTSRKIE